MSDIDCSFFDRVHDKFDLKGRMGVTDYIDFLKRDEVPKNVMKGVDCYGRRFSIIMDGFIPCR